jgi:hypothetical protein
MAIRRSGRRPHAKTRAYNRHRRIERIWGPQPIYRFLPWVRNAAVTTKLELDARNERSLALALVVAPLLSSLPLVMAYLFFYGQPVFYAK